MSSIRRISGSVGLGVKDASSRSNWSAEDFPQIKTGFERRYRLTCCRYSIAVVGTMRSWLRAWLLAGRTSMWRDCLGDLLLLCFRLAVAGHGSRLGEALRACPPSGSLRSVRPLRSRTGTLCRLQSFSRNTRSTRGCCATPWPRGASCNPNIYPTRCAARNATPEHPEVGGDAFKGHASEQAAGISCEPPLAL